MEQKILTDKLIPVQKNGKTFWLTQDQYNDILEGIEDLDCIEGQCKIREKTFKVPDFIRGKTLLSEQLV